MKELVEIFTNNGIGIACVIYIIYFNSTTMKEMLNTLISIDKRLMLLEDEKKKGEK